METKIQKALEALKAWEEWEAEIISDNRCWEPEGMANYPRLTPEIWEKMLELQLLRSDAIELLANP